MFICDIAVILIYYSYYIACSGHFRLNVCAWGIFFSHIYVADSRCDSVSMYFGKRGVTHIMFLLNLHVIWSEDYAGDMLRGVEVASFIFLL